MLLDFVTHSGQTLDQCVALDREGDFAVFAERFGAVQAHVDLDTKNVDAIADQAFTTGLDEPMPPAFPGSAGATGKTVRHGHWQEVELLT